MALRAAPLGSSASATATGATPSAPRQITAVHLDAYSHLYTPLVLARLPASDNGVIERLQLLWSNEAWRRAIAPDQVLPELNEGDNPQQTEAGG